MTLGRPAHRDRALVRRLRAALRFDHFDLSGFDQLPEGGTFQSVVGDLASAGQPEEKSLAAGQ